INLLPSPLFGVINASQSEVVNLHWVNAEALSIKQIGQIRKPIVFTLHDMWAFCGAEHYCADTNSSRFSEGYRSDNRPKGDRWLDLDRWTWNRKRKHWRLARHVICPSRWLSDCVRDSLLMRDWPVHVVPNVLDVNLFRPLDKSFCRQALGLPPDVPLMAFGASGGGTDPRKGFDLLTDAVGILANEGALPGSECVVFGQSQPQNPPRLGLPLRFMGHLYDEYSLALLYNAVDVMVVPSRQENLPQIATEAHASGRPVVAFNTTGLPDVVEHGVTGYLAAPFEPEDLARGIKWVLEDSSRWKSLCSGARARAVRLWSPEEVVPQYLEIYQTALCDEF
ncbi:MAG: glycosyltransferase, partial [Desulfomonilaceae bacterium]